MTSRKIIYSLLTLAVIGVGMYVGYSYLSRPNQQAAPTTSVQNPAASTPTTDTTPTAKIYSVAVYFSRHPQSDDDPSLTFAVARTSPDTGVGTFAISELLKGPSASESTQGYFTTARLRSGTSTCDGKDFTLSISNGVATLQFCKPFDHLGVVADGQADSEIKASLKQFSTVQKVVILNSAGDCEFNLSGLNLCKQ